MAHFNALSKICAQYNISFDIQTILEEYINKKLFMKGWRTMQSFDKNTKKIKKLDKRFNKFRYKDKHSLECYDTIHNLYLENPRRGFYNLLQEPHRRIILAMIEEFQTNTSYNFMKIFKGDFKLNYNYHYFQQKRIRGIELTCETTIPELRTWIEENTDYCQKNKLKKSFKKPELIRIIIHGDPKGSIKK